MKKEHLNALGIKVSKDLTTRELFNLENEEIFNAEATNKIHALKELCEEMYHSTHKKMQTISCSLDAAIVLSPKLRFLDHEQCWIATLTNSNSVIGIHNVGTGTLNTCVFDIRRIARLCLLDNCAGVLVAHNHPSGHCKPSKSDIEQTKILKDALKLLNITLVDHLVIADDIFYSFADETESKLQ